MGTPPANLQPHDSVEWNTPRESETKREYLKPEWCETKHLKSELWEIFLILIFILFLYSSVAPFTNMDWI